MNSSNYLWFLRLRLPLLLCWAPLLTIADGERLSGQATQLMQTHQIRTILRDTAAATLDTASWSIISSSAACEENNEGITRTSGKSGYSLVTCKAACEGTAGCVAIDYYAQTGWCNFFDTACTTPLKTADGASSYRDQAASWST